MNSRRKFLRFAGGLASALVAALLLYFNLGPADPAMQVAALIQPDRLATLAARGANPRVQKSVYWLAVAQRAGQNVTNTVARAVDRAGYRDPLAAALTREALLRNLAIATQLGCLDAAGLAEMRRGRAATIRRGPDAGDQLSVDHIIPRAVVPELDHVIANLELLPQRMNSAKHAAIGARQLELAQALHRAGLLPAAGLARIEPSR
jgi:hypothetical protein